MLPVLRQRPRRRKAKASPAVAAALAPPRLDELLRVNTRLAQGTAKCPDGKFPVERNRAASVPTTHDDMAASLPRLVESEPLKDTHGIPT